MRLRARLSVAILVLLPACRGGAKPGDEASSAAAAPPPQSMRVEQDAVAFEGRWLPVEAGDEAATLASVVRFACKRAAGTCRETLTRASRYPGGQPVQDDFTYRVLEWTRWGQPAGRLVASRREGTATVAIFVSLSGLAAEKSFADKGTEVRWRLE